MILDCSSISELRYKCLGTNDSTLYSKNELA
jgi:hypothetical protein